jgi:hypothetical protein
MKLSGTTYVIACNHCGHPTHYEGIASSNTFGMSAWTDGFNFYPMSNNSSSLIHCRSCQKIYWFLDAKEIGFLSANDFVDEEHEVPDEIWRASTPIEEPSEGEIYEALKGGFSIGTPMEKHVRIIAWWKSNDDYRHLPKDKQGGEKLFNAERLLNMSELSRLMNNSPKDIIMSAELARQSKKFDYTATLLGSFAPDDKNIRHACSTILSLCKVNDYTVRIL